MLNHPFFQLFKSRAYYVIGDIMIYVYVNSKRMAYLRRLLNANELNDEKLLKEEDCLIFPPIRENERILPLKNGELNLAALHHMKIFIPFVNQYLQEDNDVHYYMRIEKVVKQNAKLTAAGILAFLLNLEMNFMEWNVDVIGYGHCGKAIYELLSAMGVNVRVIRREKNEFANCTIYEYKKMKKGNIVINTSPSNPFETDEFWGDTLYLMDISSEKCFPKAWENDVMKVIYPGSLPDQYAPFSSAALIAQYVRSVYDER